MRTPRPPLSERQRTYILNQWARGAACDDIGEHVGLSRKHVLRVVQTAREQGDARAAPHGTGRKVRGRRVKPTSYRELRA